MRELRIVAFENACPFEVNLKIKAGAEATILVDQTIRAKGKKTFDLETLATMENGVEFWLEVEAAEDTIVAYYAGASRELDRVRPAAARSVIKKSERFEYQEISNDMATVKARARRAVASLRSFRAGIQPRKTGTKVTAGILKDVFSLFVGESVILGSDPASMVTRKVIETRISTWEKKECKSVWPGIEKRDIVKGLRGLAKEYRSPRKGTFMVNGKLNRIYELSVHPGNFNEWMSGPAAVMYSSAKNNFLFFINLVITLYEEGTLGYFEVPEALRKASTRIDQRFGGKYPELNWMFQASLAQSCSGTPIGPDVKSMVPFYAGQMKEALYILDAQDINIEPLSVKKVGVLPDLIGETVGKLLEGQGVFWESEKGYPDPWRVVLEIAYRDNGVDIVYFTNGQVVSKTVLNVSFAAAGCLMTFAPRL